GEQSSPAPTRPAPLPLRGSVAKTARRPAATWVMRGCNSLRNLSRPRCSRLHAWLPARGTGFESRWALFGTVVRAVRTRSSKPERRVRLAHGALSRRLAAAGGISVEHIDDPSAAAAERVPAKCRWRHGAFVKRRARFESARGLWRGGWS